MRDCDPPISDFFPKTESDLMRQHWPECDDLIVTAKLPRVRKSAIKNYAPAAGEL
jgi:hypothetical protein